MTVNGKKKKYDCTTCPYPRYKDRSMIFCDVCIRKILDEQNRKKQRKDDAEHLAVIKYIVDKVNKRIPVIAGTGGNDTQHSI